jgi:DNA uptake protein ComE-like DNA-binding protein
MPASSFNPGGRRPGPFIVSRNDRLGALLLALLVLAYCLLSLPRKSLQIYSARVDSMGTKKTKINYKSTNNKSSTPYTRSFYRTESIAPTPLPNKPVATETGAKTGPKNLATFLLNKADSATLEALPGIGPILASRIVRYREKLGGFFDPSQLQEVYGISDSLYLFLKARLTLVADSALLKKIDLNNASLETLGQHPYLRWEKAKHIVRYRQVNGPFRTVSDLEKILTLDSVTRQRFLPYVQLDSIAMDSPATIQHIKKGPP